MNINNIRKITGGVIRKNEPMSAHTTFRTGGPADWYIVPRTAGETASLIRYLRLNKLPYYIIGNGSNLLVSDKGCRGVVIDLGRHDNTDFTMLGYEWNNSGDTLIFDVGAGCLMSAVGSLAAKLGGSGFEALSGIPGCVGGACIMNAGAYGSEIKDVLKSVTVIDDKCRIRTIQAEDLDMRYRDSSLMDEGLIVCRAELVLHRADPDMIIKKNEEFAEQRKAKQPLEYPSAGSTFKRPEGYFAGKLISDAGLKGYSIGGAQVSEKHAGFIINKCGATSSEIAELIEYVKKTVFERFGVKLSPEVRFLGEF